MTTHSLPVAHRLRAAGKYFSSACSLPCTGITVGAAVAGCSSDQAEASQVSPQGDSTTTASDCVDPGVAGTVPFKHPSIIGLYNVIRTQPVTFPNKPAVSAPLKDLILQMLRKDPAKRVTLPQVMNHPWTSHGHRLPLQCRQVPTAPACACNCAFWCSGLPNNTGCLVSQAPVEILFCTNKRRKKKNTKMYLTLGCTRRVRVGFLHRVESC